MSLILASSSPFRKAVLNKLGIDFDVVTPDIDESRKNNETPAQLAARLAEQKAFAAAKTHSGLIIASDQVATLASGYGADEAILTKPNTHENAAKQLKKNSGNTLTFFTGLALLNTNTDNIQTIVDIYKVIFKKLNAKQIQDYLQKDKPYKCVGSFKSESFGHTLFERTQGNDPDSLIGLPLIQLRKMLENEGINIHK